VVPAAALADEHLVGRIVKVHLDILVSNGVAAFTLDFLMKDLIWSGSHYTCEIVTGI
jgi:hypothetical protein